MTKPVTCHRLQQDLLQLKTEYQSLTGLKWFVFKLLSWRLTSALDKLDPKDADSVTSLYATYESTWFPWLNSFFNLFTTMKDSLFHQLLSHFVADVRRKVISHPKADELYEFSLKFGKIEDPALLTPLLENEDLFECIKTQFKNKEHNLDTLHRAINLKLEQLPVFNSLAEKSGQPLSRFMYASIEQVSLFTTLLEQQFSSDEVLTFIEKIEHLNTPQIQINLVALLHERPGLFLAHRDNLFQSILENPNQFTTDIEFFRKLDPFFEEGCSFEQCEQIINDNVLRSILNNVVDSNEIDKAILIQEIMAFPANKELLTLMNSNQTKAMALVKFSIQFEGIRDKTLIDLLTENDFLFDFTTRYFTDQTPKNIASLKHIISLKLEQQEIWKTLATKTHLPIDRFYATTDEQQFLYESLLKETFDPNDVQELVMKIQNLPSPKKQADLLKLYQANPSLFYAHRENVFKAILTMQETVSQDVKLAGQLIELCSTDEYQSIIDDKVLKSIIEKIMNCSETDKASLIKSAINCSNKQRLFDLSASYPAIDMSQFLMLQEPAMTCIKRLEDGDYFDDLKMLLNSSDKAALLFYLIEIETRGSIIGPVVHKISQTDSANALLHILMELNKQKKLYQDNVINTFNAFVTFSQLDKWLEIVNSSRLNQALMDSLCKSAPGFAECLVYLFQQYPHFQPHNDISFLNEPNQLKTLCIALKDILLDSDINLIITNSTLRELLTILKTKTDLHPGLVKTLDTHECAYDILQVMKKYPLLDIYQLLKLERHHLNKIAEIDGLNCADVTALLQPEKSVLFNTLTQHTRLDNVMIKKIIELKSEQAKLIDQTLSHFNDKPCITEDNIALVFMKLAARQDLELMCQLLKLDVMTILFNKPSDNLFRLLDMKIKNTSLNGFLDCLATKKVLTAENISEAIEVSATISPIASYSIMEILEDMSSQQLTQNNCVSVLKLLISTSWNNEELTVTMVKDLLNTVENHELLRKITGHNHTTQLIKTILAITPRINHNGNTLANVLITIKSTDDLEKIANHSSPETLINVIEKLQLINADDDELIRDLLKSEDFLNLFSLLKQHDQINPANINTLMNSPQLLRALLILNEQSKLNETNINMLLTSPDLLQAITIIKKHNQLSLNNIHAFLDSFDLVTVCLLLEERAMDAQILTSLMEMKPDNIGFIVPIIHSLDEIKVDWIKEKELLSKIVTSVHINQLAESIIPLRDTPYNVLGVYSEIILNGRSVSAVTTAIRLLTSTSLPQEKAVDNFKRLVNCPQLLSNPDNLCKLSQNLAKKDDKQKAFDKFINELTTPKQGFFDKFFSGSPTEESPNEHVTTARYSSEPSNRSN